jgi:hypothetical protein
MALLFFPDIMLQINSDFSRKHCLVDWWASFIVKADGFPRQTILHCHLKRENNREDKRNQDTMYVYRKTSQ